MSCYSYKGLDDQQALLSKEEYGDNSLPNPEKESFLSKLWGNFNDPLIKTLILALIITTCLAFAGYVEWYEGIGIAIAVFLATFLSTYSEYKNEDNFQKLQKEASRIKNKVFRNGKVQEIDIADIVKGDYILIQPGDKIPVDGKVVEGSISVSQQSLTGEPGSVYKVASPAFHKSSDIIFTDPYFVFRESVVIDGEAVILAESVGIETQYGKLSKELTEIDDRDSPLQLKFKRLADDISKLAYIGAAFIMFSFLFKQFVVDQNYEINAIVSYIKNWQLFLKDCITALILSIIIIVVAVPEGLPMMIAIVLSLNMRKLLKSKVLVRKLIGIETSGSLNILFVDKTGTLTKGKLEPSLFISGDFNRYYSFQSIPRYLKIILEFAIRSSTFCDYSNGDNIIGGNATDRAFLSFVGSNSLWPNFFSLVHRTSQIVFNSSNKFSAAQLYINSGIPDLPLLHQNILATNTITIFKGAPEMILPSCNQAYNSSGDIEHWEQMDALNEGIRELSSQGVRVVAIATSPEPINPIKKEVPQNLILIGILGILDQIRTESKGALQLIRRAGIQTVMITGDYEETAISVAKQLELFPPFDPIPRGSILTSYEMQKLSDKQLIELIPYIRVVARAFPQDKSRLVRLCQKINLVVGMSGDGVNDTPALKKADVGFAMGSGTEIAKEASDIVILDDNFNSISTAILYGRTIFRSIRKFIVFQSTINFASTLIVFLGPFLGFDFPLTLIQLLWVNLVMDTLAALAFGGEPALIRYMNESPIQRDESIISPYMWSSFVINGAFIALLSTFFLKFTPISQLFIRDNVASYDAFLTAFFSFFIFINVINALNVRTSKINITEHISQNPGFIIVLTIIFVLQVIFSVFGGKVLRTIPLLTKEWIYIIMLSFIIIPFDFIRKAFIVPLLPQYY